MKEPSETLKMAGTILLGSPRTFSAPMTFNPDLIRIGGEKQATLSFKERATNLLVKTAVAEAGILGFLLGGPIVAAKTALGTGLLLGVLQTSPKTVKFITGKITDPASGGRFIGDVIEGRNPLLPEQTLKEKIKEGAKKAGILGAGIAGIAGVGLIGKTLIDKVKDRTKKTKIPKIPKTLFDVSPAVIPQIVGAPVFKGGEPIAPGRIQIPTQEPIIKQKDIEPMIINNRIRIDIDNRSRSSISKKFINKFIFPIK